MEELLFLGVAMTHPSLTPAQALKVQAAESLETECPQAYSCKDTNSGQRQATHSTQDACFPPCLSLLALELWDSGHEGKGQKELELLPHFWLWLWLSNDGSNKRTAGNKMFIEPLPCARHPLFHFILSIAG